MNSRHNIAADAWQFWQQKDQLHLSNLPGKRSQSCGRNEGAVRQPPQPTMEAVNIDQAASRRNNSTAPTYLSTMTTDQTCVQLQEAIEKKQKEFVANSAEVVHKPERNGINVRLLPTEPVLVGTSDKDHYFDITNDAADIEEMSNRLACLTKAMLDEIENLCKTTNFRFDKKFRLEFLPISFYNDETGTANNSLWELRINLDPVTWFDWKWSHVSSLSHDTQRGFLLLARAYVDKYKNFISEEYLNAPKQMPLAQNVKAARPNIICRHKVAGQHKNNGMCGLFIFNETIVRELPISKVVNYDLSSEHRYGLDFKGKESSFILTNKKEYVRDLLMHPTPPWHIVNSELVCLPLFWTMAIYTCRLLRDNLRRKKQLNEVKWPVDAIAINFGQWESAGSTVKYALDCHGHAHFLLTLDFIDQCDDQFYPALKGRQDAPPYYLYENAKCLEDERLHGYEMQALQQDMKICLTNIGQIQAKEAERDEKISSILNILEQSTKSQDDNQDTSSWKSSLSKRYSYSHTNLHYSYINSYSNMTYSYLFYSRENL